MDNKGFIAAKKKPGPAQDAISMVKKIYRLEETYKRLGPEKWHEQRQRHLQPVMEKLKSWGEVQKPKVLPQSPLGNAINYYLQENEHLSTFLQNGRYEIDNGWIERAIRKFAIGRNNWLFCDTVEGAKASSLYYSLVVTAKLNEKNPYETLVAILAGINQAKTIDDYEALAKLLVKQTSLH